MNFYKIENNLHQVGSGTRPPDGFKVYEVGKEPQELLDALTLQKQNEDRETLLRKAKQYLQNTDWIVAKIGESQMNGDDITPLLGKYSLELLERKTKREVINSYE